MAAIKGLNAAIYARYSAGKNQKEISIEGQIRECAAFADSNNYSVVATYADRHITGRTDNRADFQRLMRDCETGIFDVVIVWKFDRFFRDRAESALYRKHLADYGVKLISAKEFIPDGSGGIIMAGMIETVAEWYSAQLSENVIRGLYDTAAKCQTTGPLALGYRTGKDKRLEIDPLEADTVRRAFQMYDDGISLKEIANIFNSEGLKTKAGKAFKVNSFESLLHNVKYIGIYKWHDEIEIKDGCPRIVSDELFFSVQRKLERNRRVAGAGKVTVEYFLSGKLFCGHCGKPMCGCSAKRGDVRSYYYSCSQKRRFHDCNKKNVRKEQIEQSVINATLSMLTDEIILYISRGVERAAEEESQNKIILSQLSAQLAEVEVTIKNIGKAIAAGIITETTKEMLVNAEEERANIKRRILQEQIVSKQSKKAENVACWLYGFKNQKDKDNMEFKRQLFGALVNRVYVFDDGKVKIIFNVEENGEVVINLEDLQAADDGSNTSGSAQPRFVKTCRKKPIVKNSRFLSTYSSQFDRRAIALHRSSAGLNSLYR